MDEHKRRMTVIKAFDALARKGVQPDQVKAAVATLRMETGKQPSLEDTVEFLERFVEWRDEQKRVANGEMVVRRELTERGRIADRLGSMIDKISKFGRTGK